MANLVFIESGSDATGDLSFYDLIAGDNVPVSSTTVAKTGLRSIRCQGNGSSYFVKDNILADAGRRINCWVYLTARPVNSYVPIMVVANGNSEIVSIRIAPGNFGTTVFQLFVNGVKISVDDTSVPLPLNTWTRITLAYTITSLTVNNLKFWVNGSNLNGATNITLGATGSNNLQLGFVATPGLTSSQYLYFDDIVVDDGSGVTDPGDMRVTNKKPIANNVNSFDTAIGASPANRYTNVNEVPTSITNGWRHNGTGNVQENYTLEAAAVGDVDVSGVGAILGRAAWLSGKRGLPSGRFVQVCAKKADANPNITLQINNTGLATTANNTIILAIALDNDAADCGGIITVTDSAGNSYKAAIQKSGGGNQGTSVRTLIAYCPLALSVLANGYWTINYPLVTNKAIIVAEFSGLPSSTLDKTAASSDTTLYPTSTATATTTNPDEIIVGAVGFRGPIGHWVAPANGMTHIDLVGTANRDTNISVELQYALQTSQAAQTAGGTLNSLDAESSCIASFISNGNILGTPGIVDNGSVTAIVLTTTVSTYTLITTSASYPSNVAGIGMRSSAATPDTFLYECGTLLAYQP